MLIASSTEDLLRFTDDAKAERRRLKAIMRTDDDRVLDSWERYRVLNDHCDRVLDVTELYDRKTRFALLILGGLNAINLLVIVRLDVLSALQRGSLWLSAYVASYCGLVPLRACVFNFGASATRAARQLCGKENAARGDLAVRRSRAPSDGRGVP